MWCCKQRLLRAHPSQEHDSQAELRNVSAPSYSAASWLCDKFPGPASCRQSQSIQHYCNPECDKLVGELSKAAELSTQLNDMLTGLNARENALRILIP